MALLICAVLSFCFIYAVSAQSSSTVLNAAASTTQPRVGSTLTITLTISNVQNLAGIDSTLTWNSSVLTLSNVVLNLGDSHSNGVLHGSNLNYDSNNLSSGDIYVQETKVSGSYELVAQSIGQSTPGFTGTGTIATLTFNVINVGPAGLSLQTDLADHPPAGQIANNIDHQDTADAVTAVTSGSSSNTPTPSPTSTPTSTPSVPEFPSTILIVLLITLAATGIILTTKSLNNRIISKNTTLK